jgi:hypothetical protein
VWRQLVERNLDRRLAKRPKLEELRERNVLPSEAVVGSQGKVPKIVRSSTMPELLGESSLEPTSPVLSRSGSTELFSEPDVLLSSSPPPKVSSSLLSTVVQLSKALNKDKLKRRIDGGRRILDELREGGSENLVPSSTKAENSQAKKSDTTYRVKHQQNYYPFFYLNLKDYKYRTITPRSALAESIRASVVFFESETRRYAPPAPPAPGGPGKVVA